MKRRIAALEKKFHPPNTGVCGRCGGPVPGFSMVCFQNEAGAPRWGSCTECGLILGKSGRPLCPQRLLAGHTPHTKLYGPSMPAEEMGLAG